MSNQTMYEQNVYFPDAFKGCHHGCIYCVPSFQRQAKRQLHRCKILNEEGIPKCYTFEPHFHIERLQRGSSPKTTGEQFVFFPKGGDPCYASQEELNWMLLFIRDNPQTTFLMQTKNPSFFNFIEHFPENLIIGITLESNEDVFNTSSKYKLYSQISKAPGMAARAHDFAEIKHNRKYVIIEPILQFDLTVLFYWLKVIKPDVIYIGYDTKKCKLPEPKLDDTLDLIAMLKMEGFTVRQKTLRKAWYEKAKELKQAMLNCDIADKEQRK